MFDIGWSEMAIIMLVALIVIGPKDLPRVARNVGKWVGKGRALAREFQSQLEEMAREAELDKVKGEIEKAGRTDLKRSIERSIDPKGDLKTAFEVEDQDRKPARATGTKAGAPAAVEGPKVKPNGSAGPEDGAEPPGSEPEKAEAAGPPPPREKATTG
ncbi:MAG TPA: Sec-independent protein translocase protein TatB [Geminicoccaceae bacterium]